MQHHGSPPNEPASNTALIGSALATPGTGTHAPCMHVAHCAARAGSHDRSLRRWQRSSEPFFVEEEKEARLESMFEADLEGGAQGAGPEALAGPLGRLAGGEGDEGGAAPAGMVGTQASVVWGAGCADSVHRGCCVARSGLQPRQRACACTARVPWADRACTCAPCTGRKTLESVSAADLLVDALEMAAHEEGRQREHQQQQASRAGSGGAAGASASGSGAAAELPPNPMMMGLSASAYVLRAVGGAAALCATTRCGCLPAHVAPCAAEVGWCAAPARWRSAPAAHLLLCACPWLRGARLTLPFLRACL